jgi:hypothetical protein
MEGVGQPQVLVVQVVDQLVEQGAEEGPEGDDPTPARRSHPELDPRRPGAARGRVEPLQLTPAAVRTGGQHLDTAGRDGEGPGQPREEALGGALDGGAARAFERNRELGDERAERRGAREGEAGDRVRSTVEALLSGGEAVVVRERH